MVELVLGAHFIVVLYLVLGFPIALYYNHRLFRIVHTSWLAAISLLMVMGIPCPLTILEGSFIASWMNRIIYLEGIDPQHVVVMDIGFAILVIFSFLWKPLKPAK